MSPMKSPPLFKIEKDSPELILTKHQSFMVRHFSYFSPEKRKSSINNLNSLCNLISKPIKYNPKELWRLKEGCDATKSN